MKKEQLWEIYKSKNSYLNEERPFKITPRDFKRFFDQTWEQAQKEERENTDYTSNLFKR